MVSAWAKKAVDPEPLCGKSTKIMRSVTTHGSLENGVVLCKPRTLLFQSKAILHRFVFREGAFLERMPVAELVAGTSQLRLMPLYAQRSEQFCAGIAG
jgi:hypothetical protein